MPSYLPLLSFGVFLLACEPPSSDPPCPFDDEAAAELSIAPYLQNMEPESVWILWQTDSGRESRVEFGRDSTLGQTSCGAVLPLVPGAEIDAKAPQVHEVQLTGLAPDTDYHYRVVTSDIASDTVVFHTPALHPTRPLRVAVLGDTQMDTGHPQTLHQVVYDGILPSVATGAGLAQDLDMVLIVGDLVNNGWDQSQWPQEFFPGLADLVSQVPLYPVPGNHEGDSPYYWRYFHPPENGDPAFPERWYFVDRGNLRVIGLNSNGGYRVDEQLEWLDATLAQACNSDTIDFVVAQFHHPRHSELWVPGNTAFAQEFIDRLEAFSSACGKPSLHLFGHTHGYSRGQSRDARHLMVNASGSGGGLDRWGEQEQMDYEEYSVSQDEYGFVLLEVDGGAAPSLELTRVGRGVPEAPEDNTLRDQVLLTLGSQPPHAPSALETLGASNCTGSVVLQGSDYAHPDGLEQGAAQWQIATTCGDFSAPLMDHWRQHENWYMGVDTQAGDSLDDEEFQGLTPATSYCWRVRYRDQELNWSDWSIPLGFAIPGC